MSGFSYPEWIGDFYPPKTRREAMLAYYSTRFPAVEINMTFRRDVQQPTIERWRDAVGEDFRFTFKANARITHFRRLVDVGDVVAAFLDTLKPMGTRLGAVLFQTHPNLKFDASVLESFCASLPSGPAYAFEPRHESFQASEVDNVLRRHGVSTTTCSIPRRTASRDRSRTSASTATRTHRGTSPSAHRSWARSPMRARTCTCSTRTRTTRIR
jgi:uncharacterized protein YecE (DUF72 family)